MNIYKKIDKNDIISFDMFDTLIKRYVSSPLDVFTLVEIFYNKNHSHNIYNFQKERILAEKKARMDNDNEVNIDDIYKYIKYVGVNINELKELEKKIEVEICYPNEECIKFLKYARAKKKIVIITTDMYLNKNIIEEILNKNGIGYDHIYLSSEIKRKKSDKSLFFFLKQTYSNKKILHIGDNFKSDVLNARISGITSYWYKNRYQKSNNISDNMLNTFIQANIGRAEVVSDYEKFGYTYLGPLVYGFCKYINSKAEDNSDIIFLAREGNFLKKCYDSIFSTESKTKYMYVSRKSISSDVIYDFKSFDDFSSTQSFSQNETIEIFLKRYNLYNDKNLELIKKSCSVKDSLYSKRIKKFLRENFNKLLNNTVNERLLQNYLESFKINTKTIIVDIGWNGTMQDLIEKKIGFAVNGYYLGVRKKRKTSYKHGYIFDNDEFLETCSRSMVGFLEILFSANHGTTIGYKKVKNKVQPILQENDIPDSTMNLILEIQRGAMKFIDDFKCFGNFFDMIFNDNTFYKNIINVGLKPSTKVIKLFKNFKVYDEKVEGLIENKSLIYYLFHPKKMKYDYVESSWKNAFLKSIFKLNLSYFKIFQLTYKFRRNI